MDERDWLAGQFEGHRTHLRAVAYRMLGSAAEAEDAVQEAWLRLSRTDTSDVQNLGGWLTTVVSRVCLTMLQSRRTRREAPLEAHEHAAAEGVDPEAEAVLADSVGSALLVVLDTLTPPERLAFVLHDLFGVPFDDIASIVGRSPAAARQLASRGRRRVQGASPEPDQARQREVVGAFLAASRAGDFEALLAVLDPDAVARADATAAAIGADAEVRGAAAVAGAYAGRAQAARMMLVDGVPGLVWTQRGTPKVVFDFTVVGDKVTRIELLADPDLLAELKIETG